ncbi:hypothetical protein N7466_011142 [Penicillium verhagenii]|uniref:uncharacterized protein n=1 Tax=Penicillium verhagenii TaxID=1562060 RepID=UPI00254524C5|nr:uncharacterized protein N7466_011142 [Penicillium verhagenii]KAJ5917588.1 hypothetical protein N7466_011142 [Penicillium verhagenii]
MSANRNAGVAGRRGGRTRSLEKRKKLKDRIEAETISRRNTIQDLKGVNKTIKKIETDIEETDDEEKLSQLKEELRKNFQLKDEMDHKIELFDSKITSIDAEISKLDEGDPMDIDEEEQEPEKEPEPEPETEIDTEQDSESAKHDDVDEGQNFNNNQSSATESSGESAGPSSVHTNLERAVEQNPENARDDELNDIRNASNPRLPLVSKSVERPEELNDPTRESDNELFVNHDHHYVNEPQYRPQTYDDYGSLSDETETSAYVTSDSFPLESGTTIVQTRQGKLLLNSYGSRNSPMYTWSSFVPSGRVNDLKFLSEQPHIEAQKMKNDVLIYKGKIGPIRGIAWIPKNRQSTMLDICKSVEDLNPANKQSGKYIFPFTTVLVQLEGENNLRVWIDRSTYKRLSPGGKDSMERTDRRFYEMALRQVKAFRNWAGKSLDPEWRGDMRVGRVSASLTPLADTPEAEEVTGRAVPNNAHLRQGSSISPTRNNQQENYPPKKSTQQASGSSLNIQAPNNKPASDDDHGSATSQRQKFSQKTFMADMTAMMNEDDKSSLERRIEYNRAALVAYAVYKREMEMKGFEEEFI